MLSGCKEFNLCYFKDEFDSDSTSYQITLYANETNCYYDTEKKYLNNDNKTIKNCLENKALNDIKDEFDYSLYLESVSSSIKIEDIKCKEIDKNDLEATKQIITYRQDKESDLESSIISIYRNCVNLCQNICKNTSGPSAVSWTKATIRNDNSYVGIQINENVYITMTAVGSLNLNSSSKLNTVYTKTGEEEINSKFISNDEDALDLNIEINSENIKKNNSTDIDYIGRTYIDFLPIKTSLISDSISERYSFQEPNYSYVKCEYLKKENRRNSASCSFKYDNDTLRNYYNTNYKTHVFHDGNFYKYSNDIMDRIIDYGKYDVGFESIIKQTDGKNEIKVWDYAENDGYYWPKYNNNYQKAFSFEISKPSKIAIKILGGEIKERCEYKITERMKGSKLFESQNESSAITTISVPEGGKWYVSKKEKVAEEVIYNKYSTISNTFKSTVTITSNGSEEICSTSKTLIKVIPLKEIEIEETGYLSFYIPGFEINDNINYMIINPKVLEPTYTSQISATKEGSVGITKDNLVERFFEEEDTKGNYDKFYGVNLLTNSDFEKLNSNNLKGLENKFIFVRKGQILRLDYKNWFIFDKSGKIKIKTDKNNEVDYGMGLNYFILKRRPYFCYGKASENIDKEFACKFNGGIYSIIKKEQEQDKSEEQPKEQTGEQPKEQTEVQLKEQTVCYKKVEDCMAKASLVTKFLKIDIAKEYCKYNNEAAREGQKKNLVDFWNEVYSSYMGLGSICQEQNGKSTCTNITKDNIISNKCKDLYDGVILEIYNQAKSCIKALKNGYEVFNEEKDENGNIYKKPISNYEDFTKTDTNTSSELRIAALKKLFKTEDEIITTDYYKADGNKETNTSIIYKSSFYYYLSKYCNNADKEGNICQMENVPQCYDFSNYIGSLRFLFEGLLKKSESNSDNFGLLDPLSIMFGAEKLKSFSKNTNSGLIKNFISAPSENTENTVIKFEQTIYSNGSNLLRFFVISDSKDVEAFKTNNLIGINWSKLEEDSSKLNENSTNWIYKILLESSPVYKNGNRLAVFLGNDSIEYSDEDVLDGTLTKTNNILHLVKYKKDTVSNSYILDKNTKFKFNNEGILESLRGNIGINFSDVDFPEGNNFIKMLGKEQQANIFFKIIDVDNKIENNSGSYSIRIKTVNKSGNTIISLFKDFFNMVLSFIDGSQISLKNRNGGSLVSCPFDGESDRNKCYIYNEVFTDNNGNNCLKRDGSCFEGCHDVGIGADTSRCKQYYDGKGFVKNIYKNFVNNPLYQFIAKLSLTLAIIIYGIGYFFGLSGLTQSEIITKIIRFCFIYFMISANGWNFFNNFIVKFFKDGIDSILFLIASAFEINLDSEISIAVATGNYSDKSVIFSTCFDNLKLIFSMPVLNKMLGLAFSSWFGLVYLYLVFTTVINYIVGVFSAIIMYLTSQIYMSLVFCFFPLVLLFMFFEKTKKTFDNWINLLIGFAGQQIFLVMTISFFNILIYNFIKSTFSYTVCWLGIFNINIAGFPLAAISFWKIPSSSATSGSLNTVDENMPSFYSIMSFYIVGVLMSKFVTGAAELGQNIFGGGVNIGGGVAGKAIGALNQGGEKLKGGMQWTGKKFYSSVANRLGGKAIKDYAEKQQKEREDRKAKREELIKKTNDKTSKKMEGYQGSNEFQRDLDKRMKDPENAGKSKSKIKNQLLKEKQEEFNRQATIESAQEVYGSDIEKGMKQNNDSREFSSLSNEEQQQKAEAFAMEMGLVEKK